MEIATRTTPELTLHYSGFEQQFIHDGNSICPQLGVDVRVIALEAGIHASLDWQEAESLAARAVEEGKWILWEFKLGLFSALTAPLTDETQCLTLKFALQHFRKKLWPLFSRSTFGGILYRGSADFSRAFPWTLEEKQRYTEWLQGESDTLFLRRLFCQRFCKEYLDLLVTSLPEEMLPFLFLETVDCSMAEFFYLTSRELYPHFHLAVQNPWEQLLDCRLPAFPLTSRRFSVGICLPSLTYRKESLWQNVEKTMKQIGRPFLVMTELHLPHEWDGIETLIVFSEGVTSQGLRKLRGFCAAGGEIVTVGHPLGLQGEVLWEAFLKCI